MIGTPKRTPMPRRANAAAPHNDARAIVRAQENRTALTSGPPRVDLGYQMPALQGGAARLPQFYPPPVTED